MTARTIARYVTVALMGLAVLVATADGFAQSWSGLYAWALEHGLHGWKAMSFPALVDTFVGVGELGMFLLAIDGHKLRKAVLPWIDLLLPASVAAAGWTASLIFNVGHVEIHTFATQATAAVPPLASMVGLLVLLRTLHRYVAQSEAEIAKALGDSASQTGHAVADLDPALSTARERFAEALAAGETPSIRAIRRELRVGHPRAVRIRAALADM